MNGVSRRELLARIGTGAVGSTLLASTTASAAGSGRHIVGTSTRNATEEAKRKADSVRHVLDFGDLGQAVAGQFSREARGELQRRGDVRYVEPDRRLYAIDVELDNSWGVDRTDAEVAHDNGETGGDDGGADVAIIDTGIDDDHPDLHANVGSGTAFVACNERNCGGRPCFSSNCNHEWSDDNDHGTHVSGIAGAVDDGAGVVGVSTAATLHAVKVLDCNGCGSTSDVAAGISYVAQEGWDVANLSLGGADSQTLRDACKTAYDSGVLLVAAAGNDGSCTDCVGYPAAYSTVVAVSATNADDCLADFSSQGSEIELAAPGRGIYSTVIDGYDTFSGTSMASPHVAGAAGQLIDNGLTNVEARDRLAATAEDVGLTSEEQGNGLLDVENAVLGTTDGDNLDGQATGCGDGGGDDGDDGGSGGDTAPTGAIDSASESEDPSPHASFDVDWSASDDDGDLDSAELTLTDDTTGGTETTETVDISGGSAGGTTTLKAKHDDGAGHQYTVSLVVTDANGNTASDTASITENGA